MNAVTLIDGTTVDSRSEAWRHECEARAILALPTLADRRAHLEAIEARRGKPEADRLRVTMGRIWDMANAKLSGLGRTEER